jgi:hypothetical protein
MRKTLEQTDRHSAIGIVNLTRVGRAIPAQW